MFKRRDTNKWLNPLYFCFFFYFFLLYERKKWKYICSLSQLNVFCWRFNEEIILRYITIDLPGSFGGPMLTRGKHRNNWFMFRQSLEINFPKQMNNTWSSFHRTLLVLLLVKCAKNSDLSGCSYEGLLLQIQYLRNDDLLSGACKEWTYKASSMFSICNLNIKTTPIEGVLKYLLHRFVNLRTSGP